MFCYDPWAHDEENPDHYVLGHCVEAACWMAGRVHDYPEQFAAGFEAHAVTDKYYYARHPEITRVVDISGTVEKKIDANICNVAKGPGGHHGSKLRAELAKQGKKLPLLGDDDRTADRNYIREFVLAGDRELGKKYGVEYAEAFHYIGPTAAQLGGYESRWTNTSGRTRFRRNSRMDQLPRKLGLLDATLIVIGIVIGSGIFLLPNLIARACRRVRAIIAVWVVAGILSFFGALAYAELGAMMPATGGQYVYLREAYGPWCAFLCGWVFVLAVLPGRHRVSCRSDSRSISLILFRYRRLRGRRVSGAGGGALRASTISACGRAPGSSGSSRRLRSRAGCW